MNLTQIINNHIQQRQITDAEARDNSKFRVYERYGYDGDRPCAYFDDLDVIVCPRCGDGDILPGERVCGRCRDEILSNVLSNEG